jgi:hypothetical protein
MITIDIAKKVLETVDAGLVRGVGRPVPGQMCVEAAVVYALGEKHGDNPSCVSLAVRQLKIRLNDSYWSSDVARAKGLRRLAIAQLGTKGTIDDKEFAKHVAEIAIRKAVPYALWCAAKIQKDATHRQKLLDAAHRCEREGTKEAANAAANAADYASAYAAADSAAYAAADSASAAYYAASASAYAAAACAAAASAYAADSAACAAAASAYAAAACADERDRVMSLFAEEVVQVLIDMKASGCEWLDLTEGRKP